MAVRYQAVVTAWNPGVITVPLYQAFGKSLELAVFEARENFDSRLPKTARVQTGELKRSIRVEPKSQRYALFTARKKYAMAQEVGSLPHEIRAKRKKNLVFPWSGRISYAGPESSATWTSTSLFIGPRVNHPGTKGTNSMWDAAKNIVQTFPRIFGGLLNR